MSEVERRFSLIFDKAIAGDLIRVKKEDSYAHAKIIAVLQEYQSGTFPSEDLIDEYFESADIENVVPFWHLQKERKNIYRVKLISVAKWRILTAGDHQANQVAVLAIMHRNQDYESDPILIQRLEKSYETLGYRELGR